MAARRHTKKTTKKNNTLTLIISFVLVAAALLIFLYRDSLSSLFSSSQDDAGSGREPFTFETGSRQFFSLAGEKLAVTSSTGLQILNTKGESILRQVYSTTNPAISRASDGCAFYDIGGKALRVYLSGECAEYDRESPIISVQLNNSGFLAVSEQRSGSRGLTTVLDQSGNPLYEWYSGSGYTVDAAVSPDCTRLAVLCVEASGSVVHVFRLDSENELFSVSLPNELAFRISFFRNGSFCTLSEDYLHFYSDSGNEYSSFAFDESYLAGFELSDELCAVVLSKYLSGSDVTLMSFASDGDLYAQVPLPGEPVSMFAQKQKLLVLCSDMAAVFSRDLRTLNEGRVVAGYRGAVLTPKGDIYLLNSHYAEKTDLK